MTPIVHNPSSIFPPYRGYIHGLEVPGFCSSADPKYDEANAQMRASQLGTHRVSCTVVCCQLLESRWKLEIEAVAAA